MYKYVHMFNVHVCTLDIPVRQTAKLEPVGFIETGGSKMVEDYR